MLIRLCHYHLHAYQFEIKRDRTGRNGTGHGADKFLFFDCLGHIPKWRGRIIHWSHRTSRRINKILSIDGFVNFKTVSKLSVWLSLTPDHEFL